MKWCLMKNCEFGAEITLPQSVKEHVLPWRIPRGNVPLGSEKFAVKSYYNKLLEL